VSGASVDLAERVLEQYGDPAAESSDGPSSQPTPETRSTQPESDAGGASETETVEATAQKSATDVTTSDGRSESPSLTEKQRTALRVICGNPSASQQEVADDLGVTPQTVSRWLNDIPEFDWADRVEIADKLLDSGDASDAMTDANADTRALEQRVSELERHSAKSAESGTQLSPELTQKLVHAAFDAEQISREEELEVIRAVLPEESRL